MKTIAYLFVFLLFFASCSSNRQDREYAKTTIDFGKSKNVSPSDVFSISFVKLETNDKCLIGTISQAEEYEGVFYLLDAFITKTIYAFDNQGKFISTVGRVGNGPGEYVIPSSFFVDAKKQNICVIDVEQQKLIGYSLDGYHLVFEKKLPFSSSAIKYLKDGDVICYNQEYQTGEPLYNLIVTDAGFNVKKKMMEQEFVSGYKMGMTRKLYNVGEEISAYTHQLPFLYRVESDTIIPAYEFKFGSYQIAPLDFLKKEGAGNKNYIPALMDSGYINFFEVYESERMLCVPYYVDRTMFYGWYDKKECEVYNYNLDEMSNSLQSGSFSSPIGTTSDGRFISLLRTGPLIDIKNEGTEMVDELAVLVEESEEDDNPILMLCKEK